MAPCTDDIIFVDITKENWEKCISLTVSEEQSKFVSPNVYSLAQSKFETEMCPVGICVNNEMIGFLMYVKSSNAYKVWIVRFMIDKAYQGRGYGSQALRKLINMLNLKYKDSDIFLCVEPENQAAIKLYEKYEFLPTGEKWDNELIYKRPYKNL
jgi:diamine N-acetyltransferase